MFRRKTLLLQLLILVVLLGGCQAVSTLNPQSSAAPTQPIAYNFGSAVNVQKVKILQEKPFGNGQILLASWSDESGASCMAGTYLIPVNGEYQPHDIMVADCTTNAVFQAAYTGNSQVTLFAGAPRHTTVFGRSDIGHAVRIVWQDGQVYHVPLENHSFIEARDGKWAVERIELLDEQNNLIMAEDWVEGALQGTN